MKYCIACSPGELVLLLFSRTCTIMCCNSFSWVKVYILTSLSETVSHQHTAVHTEAHIPSVRTNKGTHVRTLNSTIIHSGPVPYWAQPKWSHLFFPLHPTAPLFLSSSLNLNSACVPQCGVYSCPSLSSWLPCCNCLAAPFWLSL